MFRDEFYGITIDPTGWRAHSHWHALCNYLDLLDSRYLGVSRVEKLNVVAQGVPVAMRAPARGINGDAVRLVAKHGEID